MIRPYRAVLALPGALAFSAAGFLARMPMSMISLGVVLLVESTYGSYGLAGAVAATGALINAVSSPLLSRAFDRLGQARVLRPAILVHAAGLLALVASAVLDAPVWALFAFAAVQGAAGVSHGSLVRARWSRLLAGDRRLHAAFALESVLDEVVFIVGPLLVTVLATRAAPAAGLLVAVTFTLVGSFALAAQRTTEPPSAGRVSAQAGAALAVPGLVVLATTFLALGGIFGAAEVVVVAFAEERGAPGAAGVVLALWALGSLVSGLAYGAISWRGPAGRRFLVAVGLLAASTAPMALATSVPVLAAVMFLAGFAISPAIVGGFALVEALVPAARLTEGLTWATTGMNLGYAFAVAIAGVAIDAYGASRAFLVAVACGLLALAVAASGARWLRVPARLPDRAPTVRA